jgi:hypothetical protein
MWYSIESKEVPINQHVLVFLAESHNGSKQHVGKLVQTSNSKLWIVSDQFGFDLPKVTHWHELLKEPT